jgi:xanthine phosphoribosyltransferase
MPPEYLTVGWEQPHRDARTLAGKLMTQGPFKGIVAVSRGGLIPAAIVARELDLRLVDSVCVVTYDHRTMGKPTVTKSPDIAGDGTGFLVIDDLADTGTTARVVRGLLPKAHFACVYVKPAGKGTADTHVAEVPQETWILFPWDTIPQFVQPMAQQEGG